MKNGRFPISKSFFVIFLITTLLTEETQAIETGEILFKNNCSVCHLGGNNIIIPEKNLKGKTLAANGMNSVSAISYQILNGKNGMPAFGGRLQETEIKEIATYVLKEASTKFEN